MTYVVEIVSTRGGVASVTPHYECGTKREAEKLCDELVAKGVNVMTMDRWVAKAER